MTLNKKHILVTGASDGIGQATAILLAKRGARLLITGQDENKLHKTALSLPGNQHQCSTFNLLKTDEISKWLTEFTGTHGHLDGLVHCAGIQETMTVRNFNSEVFDRTMRINLASALGLAKGFRYKRPRDVQGSIVLISSVAGSIGQPSNIVYGASKAALNNVTKGLAMELLRDNIRVNCVAPAMVETSMALKTQKNMTKEQFESIRSRHPMGFGKTTDVAEAVAFLLSDSSKWINAVTLPVDGGYLAY